jgi:hypothetical protein
MSVFACAADVAQAWESRRGGSGSRPPGSIARFCENVPGRLPGQVLGPPVSGEKSGRRSYLQDDVPQFMWDQRLGPDTHTRRLPLRRCTHPWRHRDQRATPRWNPEAWPPSPSRGECRGGGEGQSGSPPAFQAPPSHSGRETLTTSQIIQEPLFPSDRSIVGCHPSRVWARVMSGFRRFGSSRVGLRRRFCSWSLDQCNDLLPSCER